MDSLERKKRGQRGSLRPLELEGLGIHDLKTLCWYKTQPSKPWIVFPLELHGSVKALFDAGTTTIVGDGSNRWQQPLFWTVNWLHGSFLKSLSSYVCFSCK